MSVDEKPERPPYTAPASPPPPPPRTPMHPALKVFVVLFAMIGIGFVGILVLGGLVLATCMLGR